MATALALHLTTQLSHMQLGLFETYISSLLTFTVVRLEFVAFCVAVVPYAAVFRGCGAFIDPTG